MNRVWTCSEDCHNSVELAKSLSSYFSERESHWATLSKHRLLNLAENISVFIKNRNLNSDILFLELWNSYNPKLQLLAIHLIPFIMRNLTIDQKVILLSAIQTIEIDNTGILFALKLSEAYVPENSQWQSFLHELSFLDMEISQRVNHTLQDLLILADKICNEADKPSKNSSLNRKRAG